MFRILPRLSCPHVGIHQLNANTGVDARRNVWRYAPGTARTAFEPNFQTR